MEKQQIKFKEMHEAARRKREENKKRSTAILNELGLPFEIHNDGFHLVIRHPGGVVNFFPSTGRYTGLFNGRGVFNLLRDLDIKNTIRK